MATGFHYRGSTIRSPTPSIIPTAAIQKIEILPDGASAIYGSDAVAGVMNFVTMKNYSGAETSVQTGWADHYSTFNLSQIFGHNWDNGSILAIYNYSSRSMLINRNREFITARQDLRLGAANPTLFAGLPATAPAGTPSETPYPSRGTNFQNFNCPVATIAQSSTMPTFAYPYTGTGISVTQTNPAIGICDSVDAASSLPSETRNTALITLSQTLSSRAIFTADLVYSSRVGNSRISRGAIGATAFGSLGTGGPAFGSDQANPFLVQVPGQLPDASEFIRMNFDDLLGPGAGTKMAHRQVLRHLDSTTILAMNGY